MARTTTTARPYAGRGPDERRAERRARLLAAGLERFGTDGYAATSVAAVCQEAGVGPKHFYEQFDGRSDLLLAVYEQAAGDVEAAVVAALGAAPGALADRIAAALDAFLHACFDDERRGRILCLDVVGVDERFDRRRREVQRQFADLVAAEARARGLVVDDALNATVSLALVGGAKEVVADALLAPRRRRPSLARQRDALVRLFVAATTIPAAIEEPSR